MSKTPTVKTEWFKKFDSEYEREITEFRHSDKTLFGNEDITTEIKYALGTVLRNMYRVKMEINQMEQHENRTEFLLTDFHKVQFFIAEYYKGSLSIGVMHGRKCVCGHVLNIAEYTKDGISTNKLMRIIRGYISVFNDTMDVQNSIEFITDIAGKQNIV
jgi:hypothetical protein